MKNVLEKKMESDWAVNTVRDLWRKYDLHPNIELTNRTSLPTDLIKALREAEARGRSAGMERAAKIVEGWPHDYRSKDGLMVLSSRFDIARALRGNDDRADAAKESPRD